MTMPLTPLSECCYRDQQRLRSGLQICPHCSEAYRVLCLSLRTSPVLFV
jgi:hypothetical protein